MLIDNNCYTSPSVQINESHASFREKKKKMKRIRIAADY